MRRAGHACCARTLIPLICVIILGSRLPASAVELTVKDGRVLRGKLGQIASFGESPTGLDQDPEAIQNIIFLDDDLRRTFVPSRQRAALGPEQNPMVDEKFVIRQKVMRSGGAVKSVGPAVRVQPFDEFGRRIYTFNTAKGPVDVIQGITELTPRWAKVEGASHIWDMRIATSSIPRDVLHKILLKQINPDNPEHHKKIARFYIQAERYDEAREQLEFLVKKFDSPELKEQLQPSIQLLRRLSAQRLLNILNARRQAGQHALVRQKLKEFPADDVPGEMLQAVRAMEEEYTTLAARREETLKMLDAEIEKIAAAATRLQLQALRNEINEELTFDTLDRFTAFRQSVGSTDLTPQEKAALAVSGWLLGADNASVKLPVALSAFKVRGVLRKYLTETAKVRRDELFDGLQSEEAATPATVAALLANMKPPGEMPEPVDEAKPGLFQGQVATLPKEPDCNYLVLLPPEYNPYRHYPTIVTLNGTLSTPEQQLTFWGGQATHYGYIVIAPEWTLDHQKQYAFSHREHAAVLNSLRDACRKFAIDTDRVYLTGHAMGGDAAWDIGLAHPDLWAGVIPFTATVDKYIMLYWPNARQLPFYFVGGELDGGRMAKNARDLDRYFKNGFNATVVDFLGRGHEPFFDEIPRLFDWMGRQKRDFFPKEFDVRTMRPWDNFFWWIELSGMPSGSVVRPENWPPSRGAQPLPVKCRALESNSISITTGASRVTVWISPKMVDFDQRVNVLLNGKRINGSDRFIQADLRTLLEDVRTRGDRQNPFWAKVEK